jgi:hypothetical protein
MQANMLEGECSSGNSSSSMSVLLGTNIEGNRGAFVIAGARLLQCVPCGRYLQEGEAYGLGHKTLHATAACPTTTLMIATEQNTDLSSSVPTGSSIPRLESTTALFVHRQVFPQIQHSPATELHRPSNWPSTSSPPTQRSMPSTQALSTVASRHSHRSPRLALHRTPRIPRLSKLWSTLKPVWESSTASHDSTIPRLRHTTSSPNTSPTTSPRNRTPSSFHRPKARAFPSCTTASPTACTS